MKSKLTLKEIDQQIAQLQEQAAKIRQTEKADVIGRMQEAIGYYGITAADLGFGLVRQGKKGPKSSAAKPTGLSKLVVAAKQPRAGAGRVKWKDDAGHSWTGFGPKPRWFAEALAAGKTVDELKA
jgi:DNA-binding protein H-NS